MRAAVFIAAASALFMLAACDQQDQNAFAEQAQRMAPAAGEPAPDVAASTPPPVSADRTNGGFVYNGNPIDPMCVDRLTGIGETVEAIDLSECTGSAGRESYTVPENGLETFEDGSIGYTFECEDGCMRQPFVSYKHLGVVQGEHIVEVASSGGGTGYFTGVARLKLEGSKLSLTGTLGGGDRCNGGLADVSVKDDVIHVSRNITPFDLVDMAQGNKAGFEAYEDIQACAACCIGTADYAGDTLVSVTLPDGVDSQEQDDGMAPVDACFFKTYNAQRKSGALVLDMEKLKAFGAAFDRDCGALAPKSKQPAKDGE